MISMQPVTKKFIDYHLVKGLYFSSFSKADRVPITYLLSRAKIDTVAFNAYYDKDLFVGFSYTTTFKDLTYIMFLAICPDIRSKGYGTQIIDFIQGQYPGNRIVVNIATEDENADDNEYRIKRKAFYTRLGFTPVGILIEMEGMPYEVIISEGTCTVEEFKNTFKNYAGSLLFSLYRPKISKQS